MKYPKVINVPCTCCDGIIEFEKEKLFDDEEDDDPEYFCIEDIYTDHEKLWFCSTECAANWAYDENKMAFFSDLKMYVKKPTKQKKRKVTT